MFVYRLINFEKYCNISTLIRQAHIIKQIVFFIIMIITTGYILLKGVSKKNLHMYKKKNNLIFECINKFQ